MKKACGTAFLIYAACVALTAAVIHHRILLLGGAVLPALVAAIPLWFAVTYVWEVARRVKTMAMIRRARQGDAPADGAKIAAIGRITPIGGTTLISPLSKTPCLLYEYKIVTGWSSDDTEICNGFAQTPSTISTPYGGVRLLAHPDLKMKQSTIPREEALPNAREYIQATQFSETSIGNIARSIKDVMEIYKDDDGNVRFDHKATNAPPIDNAFFAETVVKPGDEVCAVGFYSAQRGGIVPNLESPLIEQATLEPGGGDAPLQRARKGAIGYGIGACIFFAVVAIAFAVFMAMNSLEAAEQQNPDLKPSWAEIHFEEFIDRWVRAPMSQAGMISTGMPTLSYGKAIGRVRAGGQDVSVSSAQAVPSGSQRIVMVDRDAVVLTFDRFGRVNALRLLGHDVSPDAVHLDIAQDDNEAAGVIGVRGDPECRVAFRARFRESAPGR